MKACDLLDQYLTDSEQDEFLTELVLENIENPDYVDLFLFEIEFNSIKKVLLSGFMIERSINGPRYWYNLINSLNAVENLKIELKLKSLHY
jgi:hypothetical protein